MVFHLQSELAHPPTVAELQTLSTVYQVWEASEYGVNRSIDSQLEAVNFWSIDPLLSAVFYSGRIRSSGLIPTELFKALPSNTGPIARYATVQRGLATGRTYLCGLTVAIQEGVTDSGKISGAFVDLLELALQSLMDTWRLDVGYRQVHLVRSSSRGGVVPPAALTVTGIGVYETMGTQRRRLRPARSFVVGPL